MLRGRGFEPIGVNMAAIPPQATMAPGRQKRCLLVLGMHNSGTSLLSNLMHGAGVPLGPNLLLRDRIAEQRRPPYDYYEDADIVRLQDETLLALQRHWSSYRAAWTLPPAYHPSRDHFRQELQRLIPERLEGNALWLVKDPRSAMLLEDWLLVLEQLKVEPRLLLVHRDPTSNISSFSRKGRVPLLWAEALWQRTYQQSLLATRTLPKECWAISRFEDLLLKPQTTVMDLCDWLQHPVNAQQRDQLAARVDQTLPAFPPAAEADPNEDKDQLHGATRALREQLHGRNHGPLPRSLLAEELQEAVTDAAMPPGLNRVRPDDQTLLPKATVAIVSRASEGEEAEGGMALNSRTLATALASAGHRVTLLNISDTAPVETLEQPGLKLRHLPSNGCSRQELERRVTIWLQKHPCDVVHLPGWPELTRNLRDALQPHPPQLIVGWNQANDVGPTQAWGSRANQLSWLALHERLPRRKAEVGGVAKAAESAEPQASAWRGLVQRGRRKARRSYQRMLSLIRRP